MGGSGGTSGNPHEPADGPQPKKHAGDPNKRAVGAAAQASNGAGVNGSTSSGSSSSNSNIVAKKKTDKKRALRRL